MASETFVILTARDEADRIEATLEALAAAFPDAPVWVADDGSRDDTARRARARGAHVCGGERPQGKGQAATRAARAALAQREWGEHAVAVLCDGDLGESAAQLGPLVQAVRERRCDVAVAAFSKRVGGGLGLARGFARWAIRRRSGLATNAPISGQRALSVGALRQVLPFAEGFGMEVGMTIDAVRAGLGVAEVELDLTHRATGRTLAGFAHRGRQLADFVRVYRVRKGPATRVRARARQNPVEERRT